MPFKLKFFGSIYIYIYILISKKNFIEKMVKHGKVENDSKEIKKNMYEKEENL